NDHTGLIKCIDCGYEEWQHDYIGCNYGHDFYHIDNTQKCRRCGVPACFVGWDGHDYDHQFGEVHCIRCGNKDWIDEPIITCEDIGRHDFEDGMCFRCGELDWNDCRWGSGNHNFVNGYCTRCWEYECYSGNHNFVNGDCRYCGEPDWNDCRYGSGNHSFVNSECISCWENTCSLYGIHLFELHVQPHWCKFCGEKNNDYDCILYGHNFMNNECIFCWENSCSLYGIHYLENNECKFCGGNSCSLHGIHEVDFIAGVCRYCGEYGCSVYGEHYFLRGLCWYCGENSCSLCGEHYFEYGECKFCGEYGCDSTDGEHYFEYGSCRYCGKDVCSFYGEHHFGYGVGGRVCIYCGETDWNDCRWGSGNHNFVGGYCISCGEPDYFGDCRFGYANHNYEYLDHGNHIDYRCVNCGDYMCENPNNPEITSIEVNKDNSIYEIKEENKGVWNIVFYIKVTYDDGSIEYVPTIIEIDKNSSGQIDFGDYILEYDIKGNGSNIKKFDIIMK
ncbi:MAG: hypothetical protein FWC41_05940, partial [Firmicutes bacterium]|nr:hypothetical protein [Bacillota bacterium]